MGVEKTKKKSTAKKIVNVIFSIFTVVLFIFALLMIVVSITSRLNNKRMPSVFGYSYSVVVTGSMEPNIHVGEIIFIKKVDPEKLQQKDIIVYDDGTKAIVHRIVEIDKVNKKITTRGDANPGNDSPITYDKVLGKVIGQSMALGELMDFLRTPGGFIVIIAVPLTGLLLWEGVSLIMKVRKNKAEKAAAETDKEDKR